MVLYIWFSSLLLYQDSCNQSNTHSPKPITKTQLKEKYSEDNTNKKRTIKQMNPFIQIYAGV